MKSDISMATPIIMFVFGTVMSYLGWATKKILENIEKTVEKTSVKVDEQGSEIAEIHTTLKIHDHRISEIKSEVVEIKKSGKM